MKNSTAALLGALLAALALTTVAAGFGRSKPAEYKVISAVSSRTLSEQVSTAMNEGWAPLGAATRGAGSEIMQTMIKN